VVVAASGRVPDQVQDHRDCNHVKKRGAF